MDRHKTYRSLYLIRRVEEEIVRVYPSDKIKSPVHLSIGQEAVSVGVCEALDPTDVVFGTYRGHAMYLAKGGDLDRMVAELYGKVTGCARGNGGSMHLIDKSAGVMGSSAIVATTIPTAVGYAYASKLSGINRVVAVFFGDGAIDEGVVYESLNFAKLKKLPIIFICENNLYAIHSPQLQRQPYNNICDRVSAYGIPSKRIEFNNIEQIYEVTNESVTENKSGNASPVFLECMTYRWKQHVGPDDDFDLGYRSTEEADIWINNDQMRIIGNSLSEVDRISIEKTVESQIASAFQFAEESAFPDTDQIYQDVYKET